MKRFLCILLVLLTLPFMSALAEPRYPSLSLPVTDAAAVLSAQTVEDLRSFSTQMSKETSDGLRLTVVTVDFLDGASAQNYAQALSERSGVGHGILLLMAVGEDSYHYLLTDRSVKVNDAAIGKLLSQHFEPLFLAQRYDEAIAAFAPALAEEVNKAYGGHLSADGLFGREAAPSATAAPAASWAASYQSAQDKLSRLWDNNAWSEKLDKNDRESGVSLGTILVIVIILMLIFGRRDRRRRRGHTGLKILAGFGVLGLLRKFFGSKH